MLSFLGYSKGGLFLLKCMLPHRVNPEIVSDTFLDIPRFEFNLLPFMRKPTALPISHLMKATVWYTKHIKTCDLKSLVSNFFFVLVHIYLKLVQHQISILLFRIQNITHCKTIYAVHKNLYESC
jgi:hypothetical protein